ncbi:hypothetical protein BVY04_00295 [bacterium M21]|nr:hypothetical protein BVY04_00295 [bacterium M21]
MSKVGIRIDELQKQLSELGPLLPGSISEQWNVCGKSGCRCKAKKNPKKHGPYYQLSYSIAGKSSTMFIKPADLDEARRRQENYREYRKLCNELVLAWVDHARADGLNTNEQSGISEQSPANQ